MTELDLPTAVDQIVRATRRRTPHGIAPFFFIVGAGISYPPIPLAAGIEQMCRKEIADQGLTPPPPGSSALDRYQACFETAFSQAEERRIFLHQHLHAARISAANFRLAHLLGEGDLTKLVFTPNFDEMLTRALRLFGHETIVCDHPKTTQRIDPSRSDLQVVHVHGAHWFYDCCNLRGEIEGQARSDFADSTSMGQLLDRVLAERSPIVVGYSGWEGDVVMTALRRRLQQPTLRFNLYWFCFRRSELDTLPGWLTSHASIRFVLPPKPPVDSGPEPARPDSRGAVEALSSERESDGGSGEPVLPARDVFEAFIQKLDLRAPHLTDEPLDFFLKHLERNLDPEDASGRLFLIREVLDRVRVGMELERSKRLGGSAAQQQTAEALRRVSDAIRRSAYSVAAQAAREIALSLLDNDQRKELDEALKAAYLGLNKSEVELALQVCEVWSNLVETVLSRDKPNDTAWSTSAAVALHGKGYCLSQLGRPDAAIEAYDQVVQRFGKSSELALRERVAKALLNQGLVLGKSGKRNEAVEAFSQVVQRFGESPEPVLREQVARALFNQGVAFSEAGKPEAAVVTYSQVVERFGESLEPVLRELVAIALVNQGIAFYGADKPEEAVATYSQVVERFGESLEPVLRELVATALVNQGIAFYGADKPEEAVATYSQVVERFGESPEPVFRELVAKALFNQGIAFYGAGKLGEAVATYAQVVERFGESQEPVFRELVASARAEREVALGDREGGADAN
jgi:tetratricopeptide (TPR) repeat protein